MAMSHLWFRSLARRNRQAPERGALYDLVLRVLRLLGDVSQPGAVQLTRRCRPERRDAAGGPSGRAAEIIAPVQGPARKRSFTSASANHATGQNRS